MHETNNAWNIHFSGGFYEILLVILAFDFIIIIHELGHFIVAKLSGIKVEEFSLFVGPKLFSVTIGETAYTLRLFPILAYVKMEGEEEESDSERAFNNSLSGCGPRWWRQDSGQFDFRVSDNIGSVLYDGLYHKNRRLFRKILRLIM